MAVNQTQHRHIDVNLQVTKALPAAAATADSDSIDTRSGANNLIVAGADQTVSYTGNAATERMELSCAFPDMPLNSDASKNATAAVYDSADNSSFAAVPALAIQSVVGVATSGSVASDLRWRLPSTVRRYVRVQLAVDSGGPTLTTYTATINLFT